jgi:hypothetical protein
MKRDLPTINLPMGERALKPYSLHAPLELPAHMTGGLCSTASRTRRARRRRLRFSGVNPWLGAAVDWDATIAYRRYLWSLGLGVAEAMDTAQRGMGSTGRHRSQLIGRFARGGEGLSRRADRERRRHRSPACGRGVQRRRRDRRLRGADRRDRKTRWPHHPDGEPRARGVAKSPDDYARVYDRVLSQVREPVIIHWLGEMFDPALAGYWGSSDHWQAMDTCAGVLARNAAKIDGIKISLLSKEKEIALRRRLPPGMKMYTGDDFNYAELIAGDEIGYSDALLGIFDAIAPAASAALSALAKDDTARFHELLGPTVPLSRHIFQAPTRFYKTGVVFMAWLNGLQDHFVMVGGQQSREACSICPSCSAMRTRRAAARSPISPARRMRHYLGTQGVNA